MKTLIRAGAIVALLALASVAAAQQNSQRPVSSQVTINVLVEDSERIADLPTKHIRWIPPIHEFGNREDDFIDLVSGLPKKMLQIGCSGAFTDYSNNNAPAANTPQRMAVTITRGTANGEKKFGKVTADVVAFTGVFVGLIQKKIPANTTYFDFWIEPVGGSGNLPPSTLMGFNCGVFAIDGKGI